jgi:hypothetical protein
MKILNKLFRSKPSYGKVLGGGYKCKRGHWVSGSAYPCMMCEREDRNKQREKDKKKDAKIRKKMGLPPLRSGD